MNYNKINSYDFANLLNIESIPGSLEEKLKTDLHHIIPNENRQIISLYPQQPQLSPYIQEPETPNTFMKLLEETLKSDLQNMPNENNDLSLEEKTNLQNIIPPTETMRMLVLQYPNKHMGYNNSKTLNYREGGLQEADQINIIKYQQHIIQQQQNQINELSKHKYLKPILKKDKKKYHHNKSVKFHLSSPLPGKSLHLNVIKNKIKTRKHTPYY